MGKVECRYTYCMKWLENAAGGSSHALHCKLRGGTQRVVQATLPALNLTNNPNPPSENPVQAVHTSLPQPPSKLSFIYFVTTCILKFCIIGNYTTENSVETDELGTP